MKIDIDTNNMPVTQYVIHELLHVVLSELTLGKFDETLEEVFTVALDSYIYTYITASKARTARWTALIERKLAEDYNAQPDRPHEELVKR